MRLDDVFDAGARVLAHAALAVDDARYRLDRDIGLARDVDNGQLSHGRGTKGGRNAAIFRLFPLNVNAFLCLTGSDA